MTQLKRVQCNQLIRILDIQTLIEIRKEEEGSNTIKCISYK